MRIVLGVTGHRDIEWDWDLNVYLSRTIRELKEAAPDSEFVMLNPMAKGGDLICAYHAFQAHIPIIATLPMPAEECEKEFLRAIEEADDPLKKHRANKEHEEFLDYLRSTEQVMVVPDAEMYAYEAEVPLSGAEGPAAEFRRRQAEIYVAAQSDILIALWDGMPGTESGCGPAETVGFMRNGLDGLQNGLRCPGGRPVLWFTAPRKSQKEPDEAGVHLLERRDGALSALLREKNEENLQQKRLLVSEKEFQELRCEDIRYIDNREVLKKLIAQSTEDELIREAFRVLADPEEAWTCFPGQRACTILELLAKSTGQTEADYAVTHRRVRQVVEALQSQERRVWRDAGRLTSVLNQFYKRKHGHAFNEGRRLSRWELEKQFREEDPDLAFRDVRLVDFDLFDPVIDDSDEFSYISSLDDENKYADLIGVYRTWYLEKLLAENLLVEGIDR